MLVRSYSTALITVVNTGVTGGVAQALSDPALQRTIELIQRFTPLRVCNAVNQNARH
jgi:hypothetical protein